MWVLGEARTGGREKGGGAGSVGGGRRGGRRGATALLAHPSALGIRGRGLGPFPLFLLCYSLGAIYILVGQALAEAKGSQPRADLHGRRVGKRTVHTTLAMIYRGRM